jgi:enoyl-CoA hydratase/carnithine racemase
MSTCENVPVRVETHDRALWITIDRAERRNAINPQVIAAIHGAMLAASTDSCLRAHRRG